MNIKLNKIALLSIAALALFLNGCSNYTYPQKSYPQKA